MEYIKKLLFRFLSLFRRRQKPIDVPALDHWEFSVEYVRDFPDEMIPKIIYLLGKPTTEWLAGLICPCGCGDIIELPLIGQHPMWTLYFSTADKISFAPSVWRNVGCKSHFFIREAIVYWC